MPRRGKKYRMLHMFQKFLQNTVQATNTYLLLPDVLLPPSDGVLGPLHHSNEEVDQQQVSEYQEKYHVDNCQDSRSGLLKRRQLNVSQAKRGAKQRDDWIPKIREAQRLLRGGLLKENEKCCREDRTNTRSLSRTEAGTKSATECKVNEYIMLQVSTQSFFQTMQRTHHTADIQSGDVVQSTDKASADWYTKFCDHSKAY